MSDVHLARLNWNKANKPSRWWGLTASCFCVWLRIKNMGIFSVSWGARDEGIELNGQISQIRSTFAGRFSFCSCYWTLPVLLPKWGQRELKKVNLQTAFLWFVSLFGSIFTPLDFSSMAFFTVEREKKIIIRTNHSY